MQYLAATPTDTDKVYHLVQQTIKTIYPQYYDREIVDFFCELHNREHIIRDIKNGEVFILYDKNNPVGTGCRRENHITRVYVSPKEQCKGYGSYIMTQLEKEITKSHKKIILDASLPAKRIYEHRGYKTIKTENYPVTNGKELIYDIMEKEM